MPALSDLGMEADPAEEPWRYPGPRIRSDALLADGWVYRMHRSYPRPELGQWRVWLDGGPLAAEGSSLSLSAALELAGADPLEQRRPLLAVGSNASPGRLVSKLPGERLVVPFTVVAVDGLGVVHSPPHDQPIAVNARTATSPGSTMPGRTFARSR